MKRLFDNRFLKNKWVVPASALILTLCIGSFALAGTGSHDRYSFIPPSSSSTSSTQAAVASSSTTSVPAAQLPLVEETTPTSALSTADLQLQQAKENAILDLIREKMGADDQVAFDQLRSIAAQQQQALSEAEANLQTTKAQITALIDKYLGVPNGSSLSFVGEDSNAIFRLNAMLQK
jgi:hypothetical protein